MRARRLANNSLQLLWQLLFQLYLILSRSVLSNSFEAQWTVCSPPGSSVHGIFQARILKQVAISSSRGSSQSRDPTCISWVSCIGRQILYHCTTWEAPFQFALSNELHSFGAGSKQYLLGRWQSFLPHGKKKVKIKSTNKVLDHPSYKINLKLRLKIWSLFGTYWFNFNLKPVIIL